MASGKCVEKFNKEILHGSLILIHADTLGPKMKDWTKRVDQLDHPVKKLFKHSARGYSSGLYWLHRNGSSSSCKPRNVLEGC